MVDFSKIHKSARHDVRVCIQAWSETLQEFFGTRLDFIYTKGSAVKAWDSPIDYVPILSDVDVHFHLTDDGPIFADADTAFDTSMKILEEHERRFYMIEPAPLHFPRSQLSHLNAIKKEEWYTPPRPQDVTVVIGNPPFDTFPDPDRIRVIDKWRTEETASVIQRIPVSLIDRSGPDYWTLVRRLSWRVSPAPVRLLTQAHPDPAEVWSWNRTKIVEELNKAGYTELASHYTDYYMAGWDMFLSGLKSVDAYRHLLFHGYHILRMCLEQIRRL